jgi:hypothetical protein
MKQLRRPLPRLRIAHLRGALNDIAGKIAVTLLRFVLVLLTHTFYRLDVVGRKNVPQTGGALLVPNHVGGEMVAHGRIEEALQEVAGIDLQAFAVTGIPDERKGERLAVLHTLDETAIPALLEKLAARGLPNLFIPHLDHFVKIDKLPLLGTGKLDLRAVKRIAIERLGGAMAGAQAARENTRCTRNPSAGFVNNPPDVSGPLGANRA